MADIPKVSIIVPIYKVPERMLRKCIESCQQQTLENIEIILVDDGSPDSCGQICDEYAKSDNRIIVIHKKNGGLSAARNTGYEMAKGKWITFLDGDDWIEPTTCLETYELGSAGDCDLVIFGTIQEYGSFQRPFKYHLVDKQEFRGTECRELQKEILDFNGNIATAWAKLIKKSVLDINRIEHNEVLRQGAEGIEFNIRLFEKINHVIFTDRTYYHYIFNPDSISAKHDERNHYYVLRCFEEIKAQIEKSQNKNELEKVFFTRFSYVIVATAISGYFSPNNNECYSKQKIGYKKYLNEQLIKNTFINLKLRDLDMQRAIIIVLIRIRLFLFVKLLARIRYIQKHNC